MVLAGCNSNEESSADVSSFSTDIKNQKIEVIESLSDEILKQIYLDNDTFGRLTWSYKQQMTTGTGFPLAFLAPYNGSDTFIVREYEGKSPIKYYLSFQNETGKRGFLFLVECDYGADILPYRVYKVSFVEQGENAEEYDEFVKYVNPLDL
jgi:hypothetical protein